MSDALAHLHFPAKPREQPFRLARLLRSQNFECLELFASRVPGEIDGTHASFADRGQNVKRANYESARLALQKLSGLETRQLAGLDEVIGHGLGIVTPVKG